MQAGDESQGLLSILFGWRPRQAPVFASAPLLPRRLPCCRLCPRWSTASSTMRFLPLLLAPGPALAEDRIWIQEFLAQATAG